jgi:hypothetical protein
MMLSRHATPTLSSLTLAALLATVVLASILLMSKGPQIRTEHEKRDLVRTGAEHGAVCDRLGMPAGTSRHDECLGELKALKAVHEKWSSEGIESIL